MIWRSTIWRKLNKQIIFGKFLLFFSAVYQYFNRKQTHQLTKWPTDQLTNSQNHKNRKNKAYLWSVSLNLWRRCGIVKIREERQRKRQNYPISYFYVPNHLLRTIKTFKIFKTVPDNPLKGNFGFSSIQKRSSLPVA